ncbi:MAG: pro-sigmaK processing inhibitor BofA family protein [Clostridia bacterium]|nr:pro-sigmaK processing inhibitor BofA family protein [Clostridia bacterium]
MSVGAIAAYVLSAILILALCCVFFKPLKGVFVMMLHSVLGGAGLYICNFLLAPIGVPIGLNIVTASICGLFGLPGLILLVLVKVIFTHM